MDQAELNPDAKRENVRALAAAAGIAEEEAAQRLEQNVLVTFEREDLPSAALARELVPILSKTLPVRLKPAVGTVYGAELVLGRAKARTRAPKIFAALRSDCLVIRRARIRRTGQMPMSPLLTLIAACYTAGAAIGSVAGEGIPNLPTPNFEIPFAAFVSPKDYASLLGPIDIGEAYLVGAGAIGNGFLWAAQHVSLIGKLYLPDDDFVSSGNLQRQIWFKEDDIGKSKSEVLCRLAQGHIRECELIPAQCRLQQHPNADPAAPWIKRMIVAVDSRRARRSLQNELPGEVFDASTTGSTEIVVHYNKQPTEQACMGCIYHHDEQEISADQVIADQLGINADDVREPRITPAIASQICRAHPQLKPADIEGMAFDSLYKQLCSSQKLRTTVGKQVIAPFAFVSVLAGAVLLLEVIRHLTKGKRDRTNLWKISPWHPPVPEMRQARSRRPDCECCSRPELRELITQFWGANPYQPIEQLRRRK